ncbi:MAG: hypothetical protein JJT95_08160 [Pararhodobacter sp.]|nr:hypothetical protein [Pararhodobacter sp.]
MRNLVTPLATLRAMLALPAGLAVAALSAAAPATAGPWPREAGQGFFAFNLEPPARRGERPERQQAYGEYGLRPRLTLAAKLERRSAGQQREVTLRWHPPDLPGALAWGLAAGLRQGRAPGDGRRALLGLSLGRGFETPFGNAWARADITALAASSPPGPGREVELAAQIGLSHEGWIGMFGVTHDHGSDGTHTRLRPALGYEITERLTLLGEATLAPGGRREGLALTLWSRF